MESYRIYGLDQQGRIIFADYVDCLGDGEAIAQGRRLLESYPGAEVWLGRRRVAGSADLAPPIEA